MTDFERGYQFFAENTVGFSGGCKGSEYVSSVQEALNKTINEMKNTTVQRFQANDTSTKGFVAEDWHAGTVNDIIINNNGQTTGFQAKYYKTAEATAKSISDPKYDNVGKVAPSDIGYV